jgi:MFS transporter, DHA3 family, macrolide efflux protein
MPAVTEAAGRASPAPTRAGPERAVGAVRPLFRQRDFSALWWGQMVSLLGERLSYLAFVGLVAERTHGLHDVGAAWQLAVLANVMLAPALVFSPFVGAWIDRRNLKHLVVLSDALRGATVLLIPVAYRLGGGLPSVYTLLFLLFTCGVVFLPAKSALTPELVPRAQWLAANTWLTVCGIIATGVGSLGGGWLVDHWGWARALDLNGATYIASAGAMALIRYRPGPRPRGAGATGPREHLRQLREGWTAVRHTRAVGFALVALGAAWWCGGFLHVAGNLHIQRVASVPGTERVAVLMTVLGLGGGLGAWWINTRRDPGQRPRQIAAAVALAGAALLLFALSTRFALLAAAAFLMGLAAAPMLLVGETLLQEAVPQGLRGRVFGMRDFAMRLVLLASVAAAGWCTPALGSRRALLLCGALAVAAGLLMLGRARRAGAAANAPLRPAG